jgi:cytochrome c-type biogenesis protein CcmH
MITFWLAAAVISAGWSAFLLRAARQARRKGPDADPTVAIYQRLLSETDAMAARGLLPAAEQQAARAEAARRLLKAAEAPSPAGQWAPAWAAPAICVGAPVLAVAIYLAVGSPGAPDRDYARRLNEWRSAPQKLGPAEAAAVLTRITQERPADAEAFGQLARARLAAGDSFGAVRAAETAARLQPGAAARWTALAEGLLLLEPPGVPEAETALARAEAIAPGDVDAAYWRGRAAFAAGDAEAGRAAWSVLLRRLQPGDRRRAALEAELAASSAPSSAETDAAINAMVEGLAARLKAEPLDPQGWVRLVRAYGVLGRADDQARALAEARRLFARRPEVLAELEVVGAGGPAPSR